MTADQLLFTIVVNALYLLCWAVSAYERRWTAPRA